MQLPQESSAYTRRVQFGRYVARRLRSSERNALSGLAEAASALVKQSGRAWEDLSEPLEDAIADRDFADLVLDNAAKRLRLALAARDLKATKQAPYIDVFPEGIEYYTAAALDAEIPRYRELLARVENYLPQGDKAREEAITAIQAGLSAFQSAEESVQKARQALALSLSALDRAEEAWARQMEKIYAALVDELGRADAEAFFPKRRPTRERASEAPAPAEG